MLYKKLPRPELSESVELDDDIELEYYRLEKVREGQIELEKHEGEVNTNVEAASRKKDDKEPLSELINKLNKKYGADLSEADRLFLQQVENGMTTDEDLQKKALANNLKRFKEVGRDAFWSKAIERMDSNGQFINTLERNKELQRDVLEVLVSSVYEKLNAESAA